MERLTEWSYLADVMVGELKAGVDERKAFDRLADYEDTMPLERAQELSRAEKNGRLVVLPCKSGDELIKNGLAFKADHWNVLLTAFADDASAPFGKRVKLLSPEEAEAAMKKRGADNETDT